MVSFQHGKSGSKCGKECLVNICKMCHPWNKKAYQQSYLKRSRLHANTPEEIQYILYILIEINSGVWTIPNPLIKSEAWSSGTWLTSKQKNERQAIASAFTFQPFYHSRFRFKGQIFLRDLQ